MTSRKPPRAVLHGAAAILVGAPRAPVPLWALVASVGIHGAALSHLGWAGAHEAAASDGATGSLWTGGPGPVAAGETVSVEVTPEGPEAHENPQSQLPTGDRDPGETGPSARKATENGPRDSAVRTAAKAPPAKGANVGSPRANQGRRGAVAPHVTSAGTTGGGAGPAGDGDPSGDIGGAGPVVRGVTLPLLRVLPLALSADPSWSHVPVGAGATVELALAVDDAGHVRLDRPLASVGLPQMPALVDQMLRLLAWPRFAVRPAEMEAGVDRVRLVIAVTQDTASAEALATSGGAYGLGADAPAGRRPGRAHCTWANGRRVNVTLHRLEP